MLRYIGTRAAIMIPMLLLVSIVSFIIIQLPPGNYVEIYVHNLERQGAIVDQETVIMLKEQYGLDKPLIDQYLIWMKNIVLRGDFGNSFATNRPVVEILRERIPRSVALSFAALVLSWLIAMPVALYSSVFQYSVLDYVITFLGFVGLSVPTFIFALILVFVLYMSTGYVVTGLFSAEFQHASWSFSKLLNLLKNVSIPLVVVGTSGAAGTIRVLRATLLDELRKQYVVTARAKGVGELALLLKYPFRLAINPIISGMGGVLPALVGGEVVVSAVLNIPTTGPILIQSVMTQDMYLAGAIVLVLSSCTIIGIFLSDMLLAVIDPRIRYE
jgi:peptide/nickel transport system permease protein